MPAHPYESALHPRAAITDIDLRAAEWMARLLDDYRLDPILGFVLPGVGDAIGSMLGLFIVGIAVRRGASKAVVGRMLVNLAVDGIVGSVPLLGDAFDWVSKANRRNLVLLESRGPVGAARWTDWLTVIGAGLLFAAALLAPIALVGFIVRALLRQG